MERNWRRWKSKQPRRMIETIEEFKKEYQQDMEDVTKQECKKGKFRRRELPGRFTARKLFGWSDKRYD